MLTWYLPSFYGDLRLESQGDSRTMLTLHGLTPEEEHAMQILLERAKGGALRKPWASADALSSINLRKTTVEQKLLLSAPISDVQKVLAKALRPGKKKLSVVRFQGGKIEEVTEATQGLIQIASQEDSGTSREDSDTEPVTAKPKPSVAATVVQPVQGCPEPDFTQADVLASQVLRAFLSPEQLLDFNQHQAFVAVGIDSGHRYQITSRHNRVELARRRRILFDLDENRECCVHDYDVPASEEMLSVFLHLQTPGREAYLRALPE